MMRLHARPPICRERGARRGRVRVWLVVGLLVAILATFGVAARLRSNTLARRSSTTASFQRVERQDMVVTVTEEGSLESASNEDVKCEVAGGSSILWIVKDGTQVKQGEELVRLDSSALEDKVNAEKILFEQSRAARITSEKAFEAAKISYQEYVEGTYLIDLQTADSTVTIALENLRSAQNSLAHTRRMARKGYVTTLQRDAAAFAVERAKLDLAAANTAKDVLERFTKDKTAGDLESKRDAAEATMRCDQASFELEETKLKRLTTQLEKCVVHAPQDGMVIFANDSRRDDAPLVEEGALVRERQSILRLPDLSRMQAKVTVHESKIDRVVPGMRARVTVQEREFQGTVHSISSQPESMGWRRGNNAKMYPVIVRIDGTSSDLRPGMTATVEILVANVKGVVAVPEQAIVEQGGRFNCWVTVDGHPQRRPVKLGVSDGRLIEIKDGLAENEQVLLNPRATVPEARLEMPEDFAVDVKRRFGDIAASTNYPPALTQVSSLHKPGDQPTENLDPMGYDKDGDKRLSREEAPPTIRGSFDQLDTNKDGFLDASEIKVALSPDFKAAQNSPGRPSPLGK